MSGFLKGAALMSMLFVGPDVAQQEPKSYLCIPDLATGFIKKGGNWEQARFTVEGDKYILSRREGVWRFSEFGDSLWIADTCSDTATADSPYFHCGTRGLFETIVNTESLRFQKYFVGTFISEKRGFKGQADTPYLEIGRCSPL